MLTVSSPTVTTKLVHVIVHPPSFPGFPSIHRHNQSFSPHAFLGKGEKKRVRFTVHVGLLLLAASPYHYSLNPPPVAPDVKSPPLTSWVDPATVHPFLYLLLPSVCVSSCSPIPGF